VKLDTVSGDDICPIVLQTKKEDVHVVGFLEQHMSGTAVTYIYIFFVEHKINILSTSYVLLENSVTHIKCAPNIYMLF